MSSSGGSSSVGDSAMLTLMTRTALWVGKLRRDRSKEEVANALACIGNGNPQVTLMAESHFRGFCAHSLLPDAEITRIWNAARAQNGNDDDDVLMLTNNNVGNNINKNNNNEEGTQILRQMYWDDNPEEFLVETKSYENVKRHLEHTLGFWKNSNPVGYARVDSKTSEIDILCQGKMRDFLLDVHYMNRAVAPDGSPKIEKLPMANRWLTDENKRRYDRIVVDPTMKHLLTEYNLWNGFAAEKVPPIAEDEILQYIQPILDHILHVMAAGVQEHCDYILDWMAFLVQRPERRTQTLLLFYGQQGAGKGLVWDFLREHVLGHQVCTQTANAKADLFDRFSNGFLHKRLIQLDEAQDIRQYEDDIKNKLTAKDLRYEKKGQNTITVANFANFVVTTNNAITLRVSHDDRRLVFFKCSDARKGDHAYFKSLHATLATPGAGRSMYQFFMARNLTRYTDDMAFQSLRPITQFYTEMRAESLRPEQTFLSALVNMNIHLHVVEINIMEIYKAYKAMALEFSELNPQGSVRILHVTTFGRHLNKFQAGFTSDKILHGHKIYRIDIPALKSALEKANMYDADSFLKEKPLLISSSPKS